MKEVNASMRKVGRPLSEDARRKVLTLRLDEAQMRELRVKARRARMTVSSWMRDILLQALGNETPKKSPPKNDDDVDMGFF